MDKTISMCIRVSEDKFKYMVSLESCVSYSEFIHRIALKEVDRIME